jgi:hypothetical protein
VCSDPAKLDGTHCDDGKACTTDDHCQAGVCVPTASTCPCNTDSDCFALDQCHSEGTCDTVSHVCSNPAKPDGAVCDDANACTSGETCLAGVCASPVAIATCTALDECHVAGTCDPTSGACTDSIQPDGTACLGGECVGGQCAPAAGFVEVSRGCACGAGQRGALPIEAMLMFGLLLLRLRRRARRGWISR